MLKYRIMWG